MLRSDIVRLRRELENLQCHIRPGLAPLATVAVGDQLAIETAHHLATLKRELTESDLIEQIPLHKINPLTGPIAVQGAQPGDTLVVRIDRIDLGSRGDCPLIPNIGVIKEPLQAPYMRIFEVRDGMVQFGHGITFPVAPMVGALGTTPTEPAWSLHPGNHGGNIDDPNIAAGATVYFPVFVEKAMLYLGDVHARQGDSEWCGTLEMDAVVTITIMDLLKGHHLDNVWTETPSHWISYGAEPTVDESIEAAALRMARFVARGFGLSLEDAALLLGNVANLRICQSVRGPINPVIRAEFPKSVDASNRLAL